jgi:hypothetical protein
VTGVAQVWLKNFSNETAQLKHKEFNYIIQPLSSTEPLNPNSSHIRLDLAVNPPSPTEKTTIRQSCIAKTIPTNSKKQMKFYKF